MAKRILVVDNVQSERELVELILSTHGFDVDTAGNADEAMSIYRTRHPDLLVVDTMLPDKNGWVFCEQVTMLDCSALPCYLSHLGVTPNILKNFAACFRFVPIAYISPFRVMYQSYR